MSKDQTPVSLVKPSRTTSTEAIDLLTDALQLAQQGKIAAIGLLIVKKNGNTTTTFSREQDSKLNSDLIVGAAERLKLRILDEW